MIKLIAILRRIKKFLIWFEMLLAGDRQDKKDLKEECNGIICDLKDVRDRVKNEMENVNLRKEVS